MLNQSYFMIVEESSEELKELLAESLDYINYHLDAEEKLMRAKAYRKIDEHMIEHINFTTGWCHSKRMPKAASRICRWRFSILSDTGFWSILRQMWK